MDAGWTSASVSLLSALVAVASVVVTVVEGRRARRSERTEEDWTVITDEDDLHFKQRLDRTERRVPRLMAHPHYGPLMVQEGRVERLEEMRIEWRERQERARARKLRWEASISEG